MKIFLIIVVVLVILSFAVGAVLSLVSREGEPAGLLEGRLYPCPGTPNCVCSEYPNTVAFVEPLRFEDDVATAWERAQRAVIELGGAILRVDNGYLAATFKTPLFRFVDDVELRLDGTNRVIHVRSASRVGRSDLGENRKRVAELRRLFSVPETR